MRGTIVRGKRMVYFSIRKAFSSAFSTFWRRPFTFMGIVLLFSVISISVNGLGSFLTGTTLILGIPLCLLGIVVSALSFFFFFRVGFNTAYERMEKDTIDPEIWSVLPLAIATFLRGLLVIVGTILFIIPGIYFFVKYRLVEFVIIDQENGPLEGLSEAGELSRGCKWKMFLLCIFTFFFTLSGLLLLGIGIFFTTAISNLIWMHVYLQLKEGELEEEDHQAIERWLEERGRERETYNDEPKSYTAEEAEEMTDMDELEPEEVVVLKSGFARDERELDDLEL